MTLLDTMRLHAVGCGRYRPRAIRRRGLILLRWLFLIAVLAGVLAA